jgi:hypothetical protein
MVQTNKSGSNPSFVTDRVNIEYTSNDPKRNDQTKTQQKALYVKYERNGSEQCSRPTVPDAYGHTDYHTSAPSCG